jgi:hypothetical protein
MTKVFSAHAVSVDGYITGREPGPGHGLGDATSLFEVIPAPGVTHLRYEVTR